mgnify:CR=1 FL=1
MSVILDQFLWHKITILIKIRAGATRLLCLRFALMGHNVGLKLGHMLFRRIAPLALRWHDPE